MMNIHRSKQAAGRKQAAIHAVWVIGCLLLGQACYGQSYIFESPNTREHMSDETAAQSLDSYEQRNFLAVAGYLAEKLCRQPRVVSGLGMFAGSTENTAMVTGCSGRRARYMGELLARYAHQQWVLIFSAEPAGAERLLIVRFANDQPLSTPGEMRKFALTAGTVVVEGKQVAIYLWEQDHTQDAAIRALVEAHQATVEEIAGKGTLIGSDSRAEAQRIFDREISGYERPHHQALSRLLWTRKLRDLESAAEKPHH